eukprot:965490-Amphidinium_carterae.1
MENPQLSNHRFLGKFLYFPCFFVPQSRGSGVPQPQHVKNRWAAARRLSTSQEPQDPTQSGIRQLAD